jgi:hypothetical protein
MLLLGQGMGKNRVGTAVRRKTSIKKRKVSMTTLGAVIKIENHPEPWFHPWQASFGRKSGKPMKRQP